jgi:DNA-binding MarR family transcriptional regulator
MNSPLPTPATAPRLDAQLCFALYSTSLAMSKAYRKLLRGMGITYPQYLVLMVLWQQDGLTVSEIGARLFLDSATLTPLLKRMEAQDLLRRERAKLDERQVVISLTPHGQQLSTPAMEVQAQVLCASGCSALEITRIKDELVQLRQTLGKNAE